jgi:hypothetical protein
MPATPPVVSIVTTVELASDLGADVTEVGCETGVVIDVGGVVVPPGEIFGPGVGVGELSQAARARSTKRATVPNRIL